MRIAVLIDLTQHKNRDIVRGATRAGTARGWELSFFANTQAGLERAMKWGARGLIAAVIDPVFARTMQNQPLPTINVGATLTDPGLPTVRTDDVAVGQLAAEHLLEQGLRRAAVLTRGAGDFHERRSTGFIARFTREGEVVSPPRGADWTAWLKRHQPVGCFVTTSSHAHHCLHQLLAAGEVPDQAALIAANDDEIWCAAATPPISAIPLPGLSIGERAVTMLAARLRRRGRQDTCTLLPPLPVVVRRSSDVVACSDPNVAAALRHIRTHGCERIGVPDIAAAVGCSRRSLELAFRDALGRTVHDALRRHRLARARELLISSDLSITEIATAIGLQTPEHLAEWFRRFEGCSPSAWRAARSGGS